MDKNEALPPIKPKTSKDWLAQIDNENNVTIESAKFVFTQAEKRLDDTIKTFDALTTKAVALISLSAAILATLTAYFFVNNDPNGTFDVKLVTVFVCAIYTAVVLLNFVRIVLPKSYFPIGSLPQDLYANDLFTDEIAKADPKLPELYLILGEIEGYNKRIIANVCVNESRADQFRLMTYLICSMPVIGLIIYLLLVSPLSPFPR